jgi:hypothetical protein
MKQTIDLYAFRNAFQALNRTDFSYEGLDVLFDALQDSEHGREEEIELDVIELCGDFVEMTREKVIETHTASVDWEDMEEYLMDKTWYCGRTTVKHLCISKILIGE